MPVFVVVVKRGIEEVERRISALPDGSTYELTDDAWLVDYEGTTRACAEALGIRGEETERATGIAFPISNWAGRFPTDAWEWLGLHMKRGDI